MEIKYFVKDRKLHQYPIPAGCTAKYTVGRLLDIKPVDVEECEHCFKKIKTKS